MCKFLLKNIFSAQTPNYLLPRAELIYEYVEHTYDDGISALRREKKSCVLLDGERKKKGERERERCMVKKI